MKAFRLFKLNLNTLVIIVVLLVPILGTSGCATGTKETTQTQTKPTENVILKDATAVNSDKSGSTVQHPDSKIQEIKTSLNRADTYGMNVSPDNEYVAYVQGDSKILEGQLYVWKAGESSSKLINGVNDRICQLIWSPNSQYLFVDIGTSAQREGIIVNAKESKSIGEIGYSGGPCWSPDSEWITIGMVSKIEPITPTELNGVRDLVIYNINTKEIKTIEKGTSEYDFVPSKWDNDGNLHYEKYYYNDKPMEKLIYSYKQNKT